MGALYIMIGASLLVALGFLGAFIWSVKNDQYEDDYTPSVRMLFDDNAQQQLNQDKSPDPSEKLKSNKQ